MRPPRRWPCPAVSRGRKQRHCAGRPISEALAVRPVCRRSGGAAAGAGRDPVRHQLGTFQRLRRKVSIHQAARRARSAAYKPDGVFDLPVGTLIAKTFAYPRDARDPSKGRRLIETRILKHEPDGWVGLPYMWNDAQSEATLDVAGDTVNVSWIHSDGEPRTNNYIIPNSNQCKGCHKAGETMLPIGPKARHLNRDFDYASGNGKPTDALEPAGRALRRA